MSGSMHEIDALRLSRNLQNGVSARGFDWPDVLGVLDKVVEETREIRDAIESGDLSHARRELGDLLLITVNLSRFLDADPADALRAATDRFMRRFQELDRILVSEGRSVESCTLSELDAVWDRVKTQALQEVEEGS